MRYPNKGIILFLIIVLCTVNNSLYSQSADEGAWEKHLYLGQEYSRNKEYGAAIREFALSFKAAANIFENPSVELEKITYLIGTQYRLKGDYESAIDWFLINIKMNQQLPGNELNEVIGHNDLGVCFNGLGNYDKGIESFRNSLSISYNHKAQPQFKFTIYKNLTVAYTKKGSYDEAIEICNKNLEWLTLNTEAFDTRDHFGVLKSMAQNYRKQGDRETAIDIIETSLVNFKNSLKPKDIFTANILISDIYKENRDFENFLSHRTEAFKYAKNNLPEQETWQFIMKDLAAAENENNIYLMTKFLTEIEIWMNENPEIKRFSSYSYLLSKSKIYLFMNDYKSAFRFIEEALELVTSESEVQPGLVQTVQVREGDVYQKMGLIDASNKKYLDYIKFLQANPEVLQEDYYKVKYLQYLIKLGQNFNDLSMDSWQRAYLVAGLRFWEENFDVAKDPYTYYLLRGQINYALGDYKKAEKDFLNLTHYCESNFENTIYHFEGLKNLAHIRFKLGKSVEAVPILEKLIKDLKTAGFVMKRFEIHRLLGDLFSEEGNQEQALKHYDLVHRAFQYPLSDYELIKKMTVINAEIGNRNKTYELLKEGLSLRDSLAENSYRLLGYFGQDALFKRIRKDQELYQAILFKNGWNDSKFTSLMFHNVLRYKGVLTRSRRDLMTQYLKDDNPELNKKLNDFLVGLQTFKNSNYKSMSVSKRAQVDDQENFFFKQLYSFYKKRFPEKSLLDIHWEENLKFLEPNDYVLEFSSFIPDAEVGKDSSRLSYVYIYNKTWKAPKIVYLINETELISRSKNLSGGSIYATRGSRASSTKQEQEFYAYLFSEIWKPLEHLISDSGKIYFSPEGILNVIPFGALKKSEDTPPLIQKYNLVQVNSIRDIHQIKSPTFESINLIGGCVYGYDTINKQPYNHAYEGAKGLIAKGSFSKEDFKGSGLFEYEKSVLKEEKRVQNAAPENIEAYQNTKTWNYLSGSMEEVKRIEKLFEKKQFDANLYTGFDATEETIKDFHNNSPKVLHFATHGYSDPENSYFKYARLAIEDDYDYGYEASLTALDNSGLILSYGDYAWQNGYNEYEKEDGILTAREISNLNLTSTELVVLSACETGLGKVEAGEGIYGLQWAFRLAGVENLIMSLWEVPDLETMEFMELFYNNWFQGTTARKAFNKTQREMSQRYSDSPEKWAAFIMVQ